MDNMQSLALDDEEDAFNRRNDESKEKAKKKRRHKLRGRLLKAGFDADDLAKSRMIQMNKEIFKEIAQEQLRNIEVTSPDNMHFERLPLMRQFSGEFKLSRHIWEAMEYYEIHEPTPVQQTVIPYAMHTDEDLIIRAQTGSGKTLAFLLPIIESIIRIKSKISDQTPNTREPYAVIIAPTGELAMQIANNAQCLLDKVFNVKVAFDRGGLDSKKFDLNRSRGCDILVLTPGKVFHYFGMRPEDNRSTLFRTNNIRFVVLDEADRLILNERRNRRSTNSLGSNREIMTEFIVKNLREDKKMKNFRVFALAATLKDSYLQKLVRPNYVKIIVGGCFVVPTVKQEFVNLEYNHDKQEMLLEILETIYDESRSENQEASELFENAYKRIGKTLIFVNNIRTSDGLAQTLIKENFAAKPINSDRTTNQRWEAMREMLDGNIDILVSTDVLARGINLPRVEYVINYDLPQDFNADEYIHRVGRCGRIGNLGSAISFFHHDTDRRSAPALIKGCEAARQQIPDFLLNCFDKKDKRQSNNYYEQNYLNQSNNYYAQNSSSNYNSPNTKNHQIPRYYQNSNAYSNDTSFFPRGSQNKKIPDSAPKPLREINLSYLNPSGGFSNQRNTGFNDQPSNIRPQQSPQNHFNNTSNIRPQQSQHAYSNNSFNGQRNVSYQRESTHHQQSPKEGSSSRQGNFYQQPTEYTQNPQRNSGYNSSRNFQQPNPDRHYYQHAQQAPQRNDHYHQVPNRNAYQNESRGNHQQSSSQSQHTSSNSYQQGYPAQRTRDFNQQRQNEPIPRQQNSSNGFFFNNSSKSPR